MSESRSHVYTPFDDALNTLRADLFRMAALAQRNLDLARQGFFERRDDLCNSVIAEDESVDQMEKQVDKDGVAILTRFQPVASDLRQIVSAMKISNNLERIGDQAVNLARRTRKLNQNPALPEVPLLEPMFDLAFTLFKDSLQAYQSGDVAAAASLKDRDRTLDKMNSDIAAKVLEIMAQNPPRIPDYLNLMFVARHLERVGDHAIHIAEDAVFLAAAEDIRHRSARPPA